MTTANQKALWPGYTSITITGDNAKAIEKELTRYAELKFQRSAIKKKLRFNLDCDGTNQEAEYLIRSINQNTESITLVERVIASHVIKGHRPDLHDEH